MSFFTWFNIAKMLSIFKYTNKWEQKNRMQSDRIDIGLFGDWSDKDISARIRVGICYIFAFGLTWNEKEYQAYFCLMNFQAGIKRDRKITSELLEG